MTRTHTIRAAIGERPFELAIAVVLIQTAASGYLLRAATPMALWLDVTFAACSLLGGLAMTVGILGTPHLWASITQEAGLIVGGAVYLAYTASLTYPPWLGLVNSLALASGVAVSAAFLIRARRLHRDREAMLDSLQQTSYVDAVQHKRAGG